ncbi:MAG: sulfite exporter TauE/SafE family protein [Saprospiraceae bacterium]|nr:sulfite exporter TauE/SafE family protein [Saprospiraceae bacterium]
MLESLQSYHFTTFQWTLALLSAMLVGISKAGLNSVSIITVSVLAWLFGSKVSTGILLPMLICADILAVIYYKRHVNWPVLLRVAPWIVLGILLGVWVGKDLDEVVFKKMMAAIVFIVVIGLFWFEHRPLKDVSHAQWFSATMGIATGFTTMVGNQAGGFANVYFLSLRLTKNNFIGTNAWLFLFINIFKLPFHIFSWKTINSQSIGINLVLLPFIVLGFFIGLYIVKNIVDDRYRQVILWLTAAATLFVVL